MEPIHDPDDMTKVTALAASLERDGWVGAPLVADGAQLLTGAHRYHAASRVLDWPDGDIPTVDIRDLFAAEGHDYDALYTSQEIAGLWDMARLLQTYLPPQVRTAYGIDLG